MWRKPGYAKHILRHGAALLSPLNLVNATLILVILASLAFAISHEPVSGFGPRDMGVRHTTDA